MSESELVSATEVVTLLFFTDFTLPSSEESRAPLPCWVSRESGRKSLSKSGLEPGTWDS